jgi:hypothetical protein
MVKAAASVRSRVVLSLFLVVIVLMASGGSGAAPGGEGEGAGADDLQVIQAFTEQLREVSEQRQITEERKHQIMFLMGGVLLVCLVVTALLGINMAIFGKKVFVAHTIFAGFSVTLAIVHAVTAIVWFFPF